MQKILESRIEQVHKILEQNKEEWQTTYDKQADVILDNRNLIDQFTRSCRNIEHLQFYLTEVSTTPPSIFKITVRYKGQPIATIEITKDNSYITTEEYNENNKKDFECKEECLDLIIESLNDYKELISTKIKKSSENIQFDLLCGEVHVCNKLIKTFSAANGIEIVTIDKDTEIIKEA